MEDSNNKRKSENNNQIEHNKRLETTSSRIINEGWFPVPKSVTSFEIDEISPAVRNNIQRDWPNNIQKYFFAIFDDEFWEYLEV